ncbi:MAG TPA: restriction endonuclease [Haliscomenobacter sp.]|uniref:restriction endonuclease n=1 Tax=Haliscomenobacter sp. TaxID=2717303 RepID=UPI002C202453|nr:restriction endonuclease [Haliscomenobacter sp.]HOY17293.1 restriction endonuclease [Haliscomenobacter sp.]
MKRVDIQRFAVIDALKSSQLNFSIDELHGIENELHIQDIKIELESYINKYRGCGLKIDYRTNSIEKSQNIQKIAKYIDELEATKFEKYVALLVKIFDYELTFATKKSHDQGIDFMGIKKFKLFDSNRKSYLIGQAKKYNSLVDINEIRGFAGSVLLLRNREFSQAKKVYEDILMKSFTSVEGLFATSYFFSPPALKLCENADLIALDFIDLVLLTEKAILEKTLEIEDNNVFHEAKTDLEIEKIAILK